MKIYRFLSEKWALRSIEEQRLRISRLDELNDPFEWAPPGTNSKDDRVEFRKRKNEFSKQNGLICFSKNWKNPLIWSHYADKHKGMALGFEIPDKNLKHISYRKGRIICDWNRFKKDANYKEKIMKSVIRSKSHNWSYEDEARIYLPLHNEPDCCGNYFHNFSEDVKLTQIVVGHSCKKSRTEMDEKVTDLPGKIRLTKARLAFRHYGVVTQQNKKLW